MATTRKPRAKKAPRAIDPPVFTGSPDEVAWTVNALGDLDGAARLVTSQLAVLADDGNDTARRTLLHLLDAPTASPDTDPKTAVRDALQRWSDEHAATSKALGVLGRRIRAGAGPVDATLGELLGMSWQDYARHADGTPTPPPPTHPDALEGTAHTSEMARVERLADAVVPDPTGTDLAFTDAPLADDHAGYIAQLKGAGAGPEEDAAARDRRRARLTDAPGGLQRVIVPEFPEEDDR